jgi:hypothetical protein
MYDLKSLQTIADLSSGIDLRSLNAFVHAPEPGKDIFVYVIDQGVKIDAINVSLYERMSSLY